MGIQILGRTDADDAVARGTAWTCDRPAPTVRADRGRIAGVGHEATGDRAYRGDVPVAAAPGGAIARSRTADLARPDLDATEHCLSRAGASEAGAPLHSVPPRGAGNRG